MLTIEETLAGAESREYNVPGRFFRLLSTGSPVDVEFFGNGRASTEKPRAVAAGFWFVPPEPFERVRITNTAAVLNNTVKFAVSMGQGGYDRLNVESLPNEGRVLVPDVNNYTYNGSPLIAAASVAAGITPGQNVNGVIVWDVEMITTYTAGAVPGYMHCMLQAHTTTPASAAQGFAIMSNVLYVQTAVGMLQSRAQNARPIFVQAGRGLYWSNWGGLNEGNGSMRRLYATIL